ncbi:hypothetical protein CEXT_763761 [Caerostris extrusa]|uniref:Uncharacterized protein n=1 Tax=Caerostris extrusa TaxID=172846 RepID=A0AAV4WAX5_CAEEX|nr:hypothetical protein CEXT_763761 [Caerostris extrusa]
MLDSVLVIMYANGISMLRQWYSNDISMICQWYANDISTKLNPVPLTLGRKPVGTLKEFLRLIIRGTPRTQKPRRAQGVAMETNATRLVVFLKDRNAMFIQQSQFFRGEISSFGGTFPTTGPALSAPGWL